MRILTIELVDMVTLNINKRQVIVPGSITDTDEYLIDAITEAVDQGVSNWDNNHEPDILDKVREVQSNSNH